MTALSPFHATPLEHRRRPVQQLVRTLLLCVTVLLLVPVVGILVVLAIEGAPALSWSFFTDKPQRLPPPPRPPPAASGRRWSAPCG